MRLTKSEKNLIKIAAVTLAGITLFLAFIYFPRAASVSKLKSKIEKNDALLAEIRKSIGQYASIEHGMRVLRKQAVLLSSKYVDQKNIFLVLNRLSESAETAGVKVVSITPQSLTVFNPKAGSTKYYDKVCLMQPVKIVIEGRYEQLANYIYLLEQSNVGIYTVNSFNITKGKTIFPDLKMDLSVDMYVFGDEKSVRKP